MNNEQNKSNRLLSIYDRLQKGEILNKKREAEKFNVDIRTIQRDIEAIREYIQQSNYYNDSTNVTYNRKLNGYELSKGENKWLNHKHVLILGKILLESRALNKLELEEMINKLLNQVSTDYRKNLKDVLLNELFHYQPTIHQKNIIELIWNLTSAIKTKSFIELEYTLEKNDITKIHLIKPVGLLFSEFYFYLVAYIEGYNFDFPTIFRIDRISKYTKKNDHFKIPESKRFEEGQIRKYIQFMQTGELLEIEFKFWGPSIESVLDRLPTAEIIEKTNDYVIIRSTVFGKGIKMWLLSQAQYIEVLKPKGFRNEIRDLITEILKIYD